MAPAVGLAAPEPTPYTASESSRGMVEYPPVYTSLTHRRLQNADVPGKDKLSRSRNDMWVSRRAKGLNKYQSDAQIEAAKNAQIEAAVRGRVIPTQCGLAIQHGACALRV
jgi:hypothetical protein